MPVVVCAQRGARARSATTRSAAGIAPIGVDGPQPGLRRAGGYACGAPPALQRAQRLGADRLRCAQPCSRAGPTLIEAVAADFREPVNGAPEADPPAHRWSRTAARIFSSLAVIYIVWGVTPAVNRIMALALPPLLAAGSRFLLAGYLPHCAGAQPPSRAAAHAARQWRLGGGGASWASCSATGLSVSGTATRRPQSGRAGQLQFRVLDRLARHVTALARTAVTAQDAGWGWRWASSASRCWCPRVASVRQRQVGWQLLLLTAAPCWALADDGHARVARACDPLAFTVMSYPCWSGARSHPPFRASQHAGTRQVWVVSASRALPASCSWRFSVRRSASWPTPTRCCNETPSRLGTYAYVNPIVRGIHRLAAARRALDLWQIAGSLVIFAGVILAAQSSAVADAPRPPNTSLEVPLRRRGPRPRRGRGSVAASEVVTRSSR